MNTISDLAVSDLARSGLRVEDMRVRALTSVELAAVGPPNNVRSEIDGYVIPYFDLYGKSISYYRVKFLGGLEPKYKALRNVENHIYFPPGLWDILRKPECTHLLIVEGEKKAACAVRNGIAAVGLTGVDSWRVRTLVFPETTELVPFKHQGVIKAKLPAGDPHNTIRLESGVAASGFDTVVNLALSRNLCLLICFDTDLEGIQPDVQRAAATLGYELRYQGISASNIRQIVLPQLRGMKVGLDDYVMKVGIDAFRVLIRSTMEKRSAFPAHPNVRGFIGSKLQAGRMSRKEIQDVALSVLVELEARGRRLKSVDTHDLFYFDERTHTLMQVILGNQRVSLHDTEFGGFLYREFNISGGDRKLLDWIASQYTGELGVEHTHTYKVIARRPDKPLQLAIQISDTHFILITNNPEKPFELCLNGTYGLLFEQGQVDPVDEKLLLTELETQIHAPVEMWWHDIIDEFNFSVDTDIPTSRMAADVAQSKTLCTLLFYLSPWLLRWRGMQLPVELVIGEAGSGKSSLYGLRQHIITGKTRLSNMTKDIRDWYAGITSRGGVYVLDNVKFSGSDKDYQQRLSDELCRLVTEPDPRVEMRQLYTTAAVASLPVTSTFAVTSVSQPFFAIDLLQRSAIFEMQSIASKGKHEADWMNKQLSRHNGRVGWLAHHMVVLHKFLFHADHVGEWDSDYQANHRLAHYEQGLMMMARVFGLDPRWIPGALRLRTEHSVTDTDWTITALRDFAIEKKAEKPVGYALIEYGIADIVKWAGSHSVHCKNPIMVNPWKLGKYIKSNISIVRSAAGITDAGLKANKAQYRVIHTKNITQDD